MTSVDSGIDTSNNSNDCLINQDDRERINNDSTQVEGNAPPFLISDKHVSCFTAQGSLTEYSQLRSGPQRITLTSRPIGLKLNKKRKVQAFPYYRKSFVYNRQFVGKQVNFISPTDTTDFRGRTPLHLAASKGSTKIVSFLLEHGADPNLRDVMGNTPLHLAVAANKMPVVMLLLKAGADVTCLDHEGNSLLKLAQRKLSLLQNCADTETSKIKEEVQSIIDMLVSCLQQQKDIEADRKIETLVSIYSRLILSNTPNKVQSDVKDLLASLDGLSIGNQPADC